MVYTTKAARQHRMFYNKSQKETLLAWFEHNPHPNKSTKEQLGKQLGIPASKIKNWFKRRRSLQRKIEFKHSLEKCQNQEHSQSQPRTQEYLPQKARQHQVLLTRTQGEILLKAFEKNRFPTLATRKKLAKQTGIRESRIQMWFQKQRSLFTEQSTKKPVNFTADDSNGRPDVATGQQQSDPPALPDQPQNLPSSSSFCSNQAQVLTPLPTPVMLVFFDPNRVYVMNNQEPSVMITQPTQAGQVGEKPVPSLTFMTCSPELPAPQDDFSSTRALFWHQYQEKCQSHKEHTGTGVPLLKDHSLPHPEHKEQPEDPGHPDVSYIMQWWEKDRQALIEEWEPREGTQ